MEVLTLREHQTSPAVALTAEQRDILRRFAGVTAIPTSGREGCYNLTPGSLVGALSLPGLAIQIQPKIEINRVLFLLSFALDPRSWKSTGFDFQVQNSLLEAVIPAFVYQVRSALRRGVLQGYRVEEQAIAGVRGRVRLDDQLRYRFGLAPPVEVRYDEFTEDIEPNRLILAAADRLERLRLRSGESRINLHWIRRSLERVSLLQYAPAEVPEILFDRLNEHYRGAVELARLILRGVTFDLGHGNVQAMSFLVDMNKVFEDFVWVALKEELALSPERFPRAARGKNLWLDRGRAIRLEPDLSWWEGASCLFIGDVKYKRIRVDGVKHPDLYQLLAYTVAAGLPSGLLVYAAGEGEPVVHEVVELGRRLEVITLDLAREPEAILQQVAAVAQRVRDMRANAWRQDVGT